MIRSLNRSFSGDVSFSVRDQFPDAWYELNNPDTVEDPTHRMRVTLPVTAADLPPHISDLTIAQLTAFIVRDDTLTDEITIPSLQHTVNGQTTSGRRGRHGRRDRRHPAARRRAVAGDFLDAEPTGDWQLQLEDKDVVRAWFTGGLIKDIVLVFTLSGTTPPWR